MARAKSPPAAEPPSPVSIVRVGFIASSGSSALPAISYARRHWAGKPSVSASICFGSRRVTNARSSRGGSMPAEYRPEVSPDQVPIPGPKDRFPLLSLQAQVAHDVLDRDLIVALPGNGSGLAGGHPPW